MKLILSAVSASLVLAVSITATAAERRCDYKTYDVKFMSPGDQAYTQYQNRQLCEKFGIQKLKRKYSRYAWGKGDATIDENSEYYYDLNTSSETQSTCSDSNLIPTYNPETVKVGFPLQAATFLDARVYHPITDDPNEQFPAVVLIPGWSLPKEANDLSGDHLATKCMVVISYTPRGFVNSGGLVDVAGPNDIADFSAAIDYLKANTQADTTHVGTGGISYGGLVPAMGALYDERISVLALLSTPGSLLDSFWNGKTSSGVWTRALVLLARTTTGRLDPRITGIGSTPGYLNNLFNHNNIAETAAWALERAPNSEYPYNYIDEDIKNQILSDWILPEERDYPMNRDIEPFNYVAKLNRRDVKTFISHGYRDRMFTLNSIVDLFGRLTGPKKMMLNIGMHGGASATGGDEINTYLDWFEYWLNGTENGVNYQEHLVNLEIQNTSKRVFYDQWPLPTEEKHYYLSSLETAYQFVGESPSAPRLTLSESDPGPATSVTFESSNEIDENHNPSAGIPIINSNDVSGPLERNFNEFSSNKSVFYLSEPLQQRTGIRGAPKVTLHIDQQASNRQIVAYLYAVAPENQVKGGDKEADYITHGTVSLWNAPDEENVLTPSESLPSQATIEMYFISYDIPTDYRLAIAFDTFDFHYNRTTNDPFNVTFIHGDESFPMTLSVPIVSKARELNNQPQSPETLLRAESRAKQRIEAERTEALSESKSSDIEGSAGSLSWYWTLLFFSLVIVRRLNTSRAAA